MAETSITINDVVFVVDCGKAKETSYDALNNIPCLLPTWISKASARQRRGRAGRVQSGECFHLYPRCVHDAFADYQLPELLRTPLQSLCLQIKSLQLGSISEFLSRALQAPEPLSARPLLGHALETQDFKALSDPRLKNNYVNIEMFRLVEAVAACVRHSAAKRPQMGQMGMASTSNQFRLHHKHKWDK